MTDIRRWLPAIKETVLDPKNTVVRKAALGVAGLAVVGATVGGVVAGPAPAAQGTQAAAPVVAVQQPEQAVQQAEHLDKSKAKSVRYSYEAQPNFYYCGPAATRIALTAQGKVVSQDDLAKPLGTTVNGTNSVEDISRVLNGVTGKHAYKPTSIPGEKATAAQTAKFRLDAVKAIDEGRAVVTNIVGSANSEDGRWLSFPGGHYVTVVGYSDGGQRMKIADPANPNHGSYWMSTNDLANWMATRGYSA